MRVFHEHATTAAVDIDGDQSFVKPGNPQGAQERVDTLLPLEAGVVPRSIARLVNLVEVGCPQKLAVIGEYPLVMAETSIGGVEALVVRAAGKAPLHVVNHARVIDKGGVVALVAQVGQVGPAGDVGLRQP